ncbi:MAG: dihydrofolate reductase family protein [Corynebacterium kroppenstedtii]|nr:dihydrofolate reductase family protein [Corynebacterium kroppenstedtii]
MTPSPTVTVFPPENDPDIDSALERFLPYPAAQTLNIRAIMVSTIDGASIASSGTSGELGGPIDTNIFALHRRQTEAVIAGLSTALTEGYGPIEFSANEIATRAHRGLPPTADLVLTIHQLDNEKLSDILASPLTTTDDTNDDQSESVHRDNDSDNHSSEEIQHRGSVIILTDRSASEASTFSKNRTTLRNHGINVDVLDELDGTHIRQWLSNRYSVVDCEGGPRFLGSLISSRAIDEVILTIHPGVQAGNAPRIAYGTSDGTDEDAKTITGAPTGGELLAIGYDQDGAVFLRYGLRNEHT